MKDNQNKDFEETSGALEKQNEIEREQSELNAQRQPAGDKEVLVSVKNLKQYFNVGKRNEVRAIEDISFDIFKGETFGLVGESGCGKSTTGKALIKLNDATSGEVYYEGVNIQDIKNHKDMLKFNKKIQMIFQDPYASLNPRLKVMDIIAEGIDIHKLAKSTKERKKRVYDLLETVGLNKEHANRYPHESQGDKDNVLVSHVH